MHTRRLLFVYTSTPRLKMFNYYLNIVVCYMLRKNRDANNMCITTDNSTELCNSKPVNNVRTVDNFCGANYEVHCVCICVLIITMKRIKIGVINK